MANHGLYHQQTNVTVHFSPWFSGYLLIYGMVQVLIHTMAKLHWQSPVRHKVFTLPQQDVFQSQHAYTCQVFHLRLWLTKFLKNIVEVQVDYISSVQSLKFWQGRISFCWSHGFSVFVLVRCPSAIYSHNLLLKPVIPEVFFEVFSVNLQLNKSLKMDRILKPFSFPQSRQLSQHFYKQS